MRSHGNNANQLVALPQDPKVFGARLAGLRAAANLSQGALAKLVGVSRPQVSQWESGSYPGGEKVVPLARALGTDPAYLMLGEESTAGQARTRADAVEVAKAEIARALREAIARTLNDFESAAASLRGDPVLPKKRGSGPAGGPQ